MKSYEASCTIQATSEQIWNILIDGANYTGWDSGVEKLKGKIARGEKISVFSKIAPGQAFPVLVKEFVPNQLMVWEGGMPFGLFKGMRTFSLEPNRGTVRFTMREEFSGLLLPLIWRTMPDLGPSFEQFAQGLKAKAESL